MRRARAGTLGLGFLQVSGISELSGGHLGIDVQVPYPILIAAIDPAAEARLDGLSRAVVSGRYLPEPRNGVSEPRIGGTAPGGHPLGHYPVLVSSLPYTDLSLIASIYDLGSPRPGQLTAATSLRHLAALRGGRAVGRAWFTAKQAYHQFLGDLTRPTRSTDLYMAVVLAGGTYRVYLARPGPDRASNGDQPSLGMEFAAD